MKTAQFVLAFLPQLVLPSEALVPQLAALHSLCVLFNSLTDVAVWPATSCYVLA